jgi:hypothetical protein
MSRSTRRSQSVVPFGVGSIVEFEDEALMAAGLDVWPPSETINDERLAQRLGVKEFRLPPADSSAGSVPYLRFPQWHFCPRCRALQKADLYAQERPRCTSPGNPKRVEKVAPCAKLPEKRRPRMLPLRFLAVCEAGHIEDFPWSAWVHAEAKTGLNREAGCKPEALFFYATTRGGLSGLIVDCASCDRTRSLLGVTSRGGLKGLQCRGERPWLGKGSEEPCSLSGNAMLALQRGASNLYFSEVASSILIPPYSNRVTRLLDDPRVRQSLTASDGESPASDEVFAAIATVKRVDATQLKAAYVQRREIQRSAVEVDETEFRRTEWGALQQPRLERDDALVCTPEARESYAAILHDFIMGVTLVERLTETRALTSFSRIKPVISARLSRAATSWLPAFQVHGEGIFLRFDMARLRRLGRDHLDRVGVIAGRARKAMKSSSLEISASLIFLHTFAHLLIKRLSFEAGYGASSIRERLYSSESPLPMSGILLYTAAGDADGTLGGLVSLGRPGKLERIVAAAIDDGRWCAADPICIESSGQGPESLNLAACHACTLLPETSCELQNRYLDRRVVQQFFAAI